KSCDLGVTLLSIDVGKSRGELSFLEVFTSKERGINITSRSNIGNTFKKSPRAHLLMIKAFLISTYELKDILGEEGSKIFQYFLFS
ncbi:MAG: hypothetical protein ACFFDT_28755, partial [Candidatus Hodarchaeota archaeon]